MIKLSIMNLLKPYFMYRPKQLLKRIIREFQTPVPTEVLLPWGIRLNVDPRESVGNAIWRTGVYEIDTTETICRLIQNGSVAVDVGANIGYITTLMMVCAGSKGSVFSFEPHPEIFKDLSGNVAKVKEQRDDVARATLFNLALSDGKGTGSLLTDAGFSQNRGIARLGKAAPGQIEIKVETETLDTLLGNQDIDLLKIDVEGHELQVLRGSCNLLAARKISNIIFEDHQGFDSEVQNFLKNNGYTIYQLSWKLRKPLLLAKNEQNKAHKSESPNFLATLYPEKIKEIFRKSGWKSLESL